MTQIVQQPYNLFAQQKMAGYPSYQDTQKRVPGQVQGETPEQFAAGKQAANSQTGAVYDDHEMKRYSREKGDYWGDPLGAQKWQAEENRRQKQQTQPVLDGSSSTAGMDYLNSLYTSPQEEERLRKANVMNQRILAIGDALRHIGNIANTVNYAPSQQFNNPALEAEARYEKGKALRDRANQQYYTYQQAKAAQDAKARQWEAEQKYKREKDKRDFNYNAAKYANDFAYRKDKDARDYAFNLQKRKEDMDWKQKVFDQNEAHHRQSQAVQWYNANTSRMNAMNRSKEDNEKNVIYSRRGYLTFPGATEHDLKNIYDNMYEWGKSRGYIKENDLLAGINPDLFGGKKISDVSKREAVNQMVMEHDDAAVQLHHKHRGKWHEQKPNDKKSPYSQYIVQPGNGGNTTDYSKYIRK